jgi:hypothetical protein
VVDEFQGPVLNGNVSVAVGSTTRNGNTSNGGVATITSVPTGSASVSVTASGFLDGSANVTVAENQQASTTIELIRVTQPAAALLTSTTSSSDGQNVTFSIDVLVVDKNGDPIENMTQGEFTLQPCTDDSAEEDCLQNAPDTSYTVTSGPSNFTPIPGLPAEPYAAMLLIDQSQSIRTTDPADARLFASKVFMNNLGPDDHVAVSAFAQTQGGQNALIPDQPVTVVTGFTQNAAPFFGDIDVLAQQEGGGTPLYDSLDLMLEYTDANAPGSVMRHAVVLFTDGDDSTCNRTDCGVDDSVANSQALEVDIFTVGLGPDVSFNVMKSLADGGNGFFLFAENAEQLFPIYKSLGRLLSRALLTYRMEWQIHSDEANAFPAGSLILGTVTIAAGTDSISLPVRVIVP